jgi:uncharacterized protein YlzI (FlbEa/FlbD family)
MLITLTSRTGGNISVNTDYIVWLIERDYGTQVQMSDGSCFEARESKQYLVDTITHTRRVSQ